MKGSGPSTTSCTRASRLPSSPPAPPLPGAAAGAPTRTRGSSSADREHELRPRARARVRRGARGARHRRLRRQRAAARPLLAPAAGAGPTADRRPEHVRDRALARAPDDPAQAARRRRPAPRAGVGELRDHRGRLHRLPRPLGADRGRPGGPRGQAAAEPLPVPRVRDGRLEPAPHPEPHLGGAARRVSLVGRAAPPSPLARAFWRRFDVTPLDVDPRRTSSCSSGGSRPREREPPSSPYKGLNAFEDSELDALLFFGREREREIVVANLIASRLTVLYGPSGVGKSSLLRAAVARSLRELPEEPLVVVFSRWSDDPRRARGAVAKPAGTRTDGHAPSPPRPAETSTSCSTRRRSTSSTTRTTRARLVRRGAAGGPRRTVRVNVLVSLREDSLAKLDRFTGRIPGLFANTLRLDRLDRPRPARRSCDQSTASPS